MCTFVDVHVVYIAGYIGTMSIGATVYSTISSGE